MNILGVNISNGAVDDPEMNVLEERGYCHFTARE